MTTKLLGSLGLTALLLVPAACTTDGGDEGANETSASGDGDGDASGDGDGDSGDGDGDTSGDGDGDSSGDGDGDTGDGDGDTGDGDGDPAGPNCDETHAPGEGAAEGEDCTLNEDCASGVCLLFQDAPPVTGTCEPIPEGCATRLFGRVMDFSTRAPLPGANLRAISAVDASLDPAGAAGVAQAVIDDNGEFDMLTEGQLNAPIGLIGAIDAEGYYLTATGLVSPIVNNTLYGPANINHDLWAVPSEALSGWSDLLAEDPEFANFVPLGDEGGVVGFTRDAQTGEPVGGVVIAPTQGAESNALIRYLNEAGDGFTTDQTASSGVFVIVNPALGETFVAEVDGMAVGDEGRAGSTTGGIFTLVMDV